MAITGDRVASGMRATRGRWEKTVRRFSRNCCSIFNRIQAPVAAGELVHRRTAAAGAISIGSIGYFANTMPLLGGRVSGEAPRLNRRTEPPAPDRRKKRKAGGM